MQVAQSHGRLFQRIVHLTAVLSIPVILSGVGWSWLTNRVRDTQEQAEKHLRTKRISDQAQILSDFIVEEVETLRSNSISLAYSLQHSDKTFKFPAQAHILHWTEIEVQDGKPLTTVAALRNPLWNANSSIEESYLKKLKARLVADPTWVSQIEKAGISVLRIQRDNLGTGEWMSFAFSAPHSKNAFFLALVDPTQLFSAFQRWAAHSNSGNIRAYLVGSDGLILAHSQSNWVSSQLNDTNFFKQQLQKVFEGKVMSGSGDFVSMDQMPVNSAYHRVNHMPFVVVTEELRLVESGFWLNKRTFVMGFFLVLGLMGVVLVCAVFLNSKLVRTITLSVHTRPSLDFGSAEPEPRPKPDPLTKSNRFFQGDDLLILDPIQKMSSEEPEH